LGEIVNAYELGGSLLGLGKVLVGTGMLMISVGAFSKLVESGRGSADEQQRWVLQMQRALVPCHGALDGVDSLVGKLDDDPLLMASKKWRSEMIEHLAEVIACGSKIRRLKRLSNVNDTHEDCLAATEHYDRAVRLVVEAMTGFDRTKLHQAARERWLGEGHANRASAKAEELRDPQAP